MVETDFTAAKVLWDRFDALRGKANDPKADKISKITIEILDHYVAPSTIRGWIRHSNVPRSERSDNDFITVVTALYILAQHGTGPYPTDFTLPDRIRKAWLARLRAAQTDNRTTPPKPAILAGHDNTIVTTPQQPSSPRLDRKRRRWTGPALTLTLATAFMLFTSDTPIADTSHTTEQHRDDLNSIENRRGTGWHPTATVTLPNGGPVVACPPASNTPDSSAQAEDQLAYAEYYREQNLFLLYDNAPDSRSAVLELKIPGVLNHADWSNSRGWTCRGSTRPLPKVVQPNLLQADHTVQYRVCVRDASRDGPLDDCGPWTTDKP